MATTWSAFDVIGPVMVGPSSSHTAGAVKIGYFARIINGQQPKKVILGLHGSFAEVYRGHFTDAALVGGLLGFLPDNPQIKDALKIAEKSGMEVVISPTNLGDTVHPNSVLIEMKNKDGTYHRVRAKSIGGGKTVIREIDKVDCEMPIDYSTLLIMFDSREVSVFEILDHIKSIHKKIVSFEMNNYKEKTLLDVEIHKRFAPTIIDDLKKVKGVDWIRYLNHISNYN